MKTVRKGTCPGLSGTNKITYEIGVEADQTLWLRLLNSSRGGYVSKSWVSMDGIIKTLLETQTKD